MAFVVNIAMEVSGILRLFSINSAILREVRHDITMGHVNGIIPDKLDPTVSKLSYS